VGNPVYTLDLPTNSGNFQYLSVSRAGDRTFLYYGLESTGARATRVEQLLDVSSLDNLSPNIFEVTAAGADYTDPCNGFEVDYWGDYYNLNAYGLENIMPRNGMFSGKYFYRAALGIFDVHELTQVDPSASITTTTQGATAWMGDPIDYGTIAGGDCSPGFGQWCWLVEVIPSAGETVSYAPLPSNMVSGCDGSFSSPQTFTYSCEEKGRCGDATTGVTAWNLSCGDIEDGTVSEASLTLKDPAVEVSANGTTSIQECQTAVLDGSLEGRGPANWRWEIDGVEVLGCSGSVSSATDLSTAGLQTCSWTADQFDDIFADDFETGDCGLWSTATSPCASSFRGPETFLDKLRGAGVTATFRAWDPACLLYTSPSPRD